MDLFRRGLIYRGEKMLHYCPTLQSVVSDVEVDWQDISRRQKLPLPSGQSVEVGVGDVAVAVNSHDSHHMVVFSTSVDPAVPAGTGAKPPHRSSVAPPR